MLSATECIRKILDAATSDNIQQAIDALNEYATQYHLNKKPTGFAAISSNTEEKRSVWPRVATNSLNAIP